MRTKKVFEPGKVMNCICELDKCPGCGSDLVICYYYYFVRLSFIISHDIFISLSMPDSYLQFSFFD